MNQHTMKDLIAEKDLCRHNYGGIAVVTLNRKEKDFIR